MKKLILLSALTLLLLVSCSSGDYTVTYVTDGRNTSETYPRGSAPLLPETPTRDEYTFTGWAFDEAGNTPYRGGSPLDSDVTLYATWRFDAADIVNTLYTGAMETCVHVTATSYNTLFGVITDTDTSQGSGVIVAEQTGVYYCITNAHVVERAEIYSSSSYTVTDCYGNEVAAELIAADPDTDLALLRFAKGAKHLVVTPIAQKPVALGDTVISLGSPDGMRNSATVGNVTKLAPVSGEGSENGTEVDFDVIWHDAPVAHGSSGGALLNTKLELVGINFAIATNGQSGEFLWGFTVPASYVRTFIENNLK